MVVPTLRRPGAGDASQAANASGFTSRLAIRVSSTSTSRSSSRLRCNIFCSSQIQLTGKRRGGAVSGNFVMLELLGGGYQAGIAEVVSAEYAKHFPRFMDEGLHGLGRCVPLG